MPSTGEFRLVRPDAALAGRGVQVLVGGPEASAGVPIHGHLTNVQERVAGFLSYARSIDLDITRQVVALAGVQAGDVEAERIVGMCLWVPAPGRTAMLFAPNQSEFPETATATTGAIAAALDDARDGGIVLAQVMMEPADGAGKTVFAAAGLTQLATLTYMERKPPPQPPPAPTLELPPGYTPNLTGAYALLILRSDFGQLRGNPRLPRTLQLARHRGCHPRPQSRRAVRSAVVVGHPAVRKTGGMFAPGRNSSAACARTRLPGDRRSGARAGTRTYPDAARAGNRDAPALRSGDAGSGCGEWSGTSPLQAMRIHQRRTAHRDGAPAEVMS